MDNLRDAIKTAIKVGRHDVADELKRMLRKPKFQVKSDVIDKIKYLALDLMTPDEAFLTLPYDELLLDLPKSAGLLSLRQVNKYIIAATIYVYKTDGIMRAPKQLTLSIINGSVVIECGNDIMVDAKTKSFNPDACRANAVEFIFLPQVVAFLVLLNSKARKQRLLKADAEKNKNLPKGVIPFSDYHLLELDFEEFEREVDERKKEISNRKQPREHERRRHIRRYKSGKIAVIEKVTINKGIGHRVDKDYSL